MVTNSDQNNSHKKFVEQRVKKYGLSSQRKIPYYKSRQMLQENGFVLSERSKNCVFTNGGSESLRHWIIKCIIFKILRNHGREVGTEVEVDNGVVDVLDVDNLIAYEIETDLTKEKIIDKIKNLNSVRDVFFIDTREVPNDFFEAEKYLKEKII